MTSNAGGAKKLLSNLLGEWNGNVPQVIVLEFPPADLFPNRAKGRHWGSLYQMRSVYRENSFLLSLSQLKNWKHHGGPISLDLIFEMPDKRHRDADNCLSAAKGALDGLADALFVNDKMFDPITVRRKPGKKPGRLIITITQGETE
jgi:crossover junction endodeoxyribonuclease RusA